MRTAAVIVGDMRGLVKWLSRRKRREDSPKGRIDMLRRLSNLGWIVAFVALCVFWISEVVRATRQSELARATGANWVCPIAGNCGPPGTPGLGRW
jgi:hypothetical protein